MAGDLEKRLTDVYGAAGDRQRLDALYDDWSASYDADIWASGNPYLAIVCAMVGRHVPGLDTRILDAGCGSGLLGQLLAQTGYRHLDGLDASQGMLDAARAKRCYRALHRLLLDAHIELPPASYDAIVAAGVLTHGHAPPQALDGMLALAAPGAPIIFSLSKIAAEQGGFNDRIRALESDGSWHRIEQTEAFPTYPFSVQYAGLRHWVCVYRKHA